MKVKEILKLLEEDGWYLARTKGSHRQLRHSNKPGTVTVSGKPSIDVPPGTLNSIFEASWIEEMGAIKGMRYAVIVEEGETSFGAYVPDLPGCVAVAESRAEVLRLIEEAIEFHIEGMRQDNQAIPQPSSSIEYVEVRAA